MRMPGPGDGGAVHEAASREADNIMALERAVERLEGRIAEKLDVVVREDGDRMAARIEAALIAFAQGPGVADHDDLLVVVGERAREVVAHGRFAGWVDAADDDGV